MNFGLNGKQRERKGIEKFFKGVWCVYTACVLHWGFLYLFWEHFIKWTVESYKSKDCALRQQSVLLTLVVYPGQCTFPCLLHAKWLISKSRDIELTFEVFLYIKRLWCSGTGIHSNSKGHSSHVLSMAPETLQLLTSYSVLAPAVASPTWCGQQELYIELEGWGILEMHSISGCNWSQNTFTLLNLTKSGRGMASICSSARLKLYFQPLPAVTFLYCFLWNFPSISHLPT